MSMLLSVLSSESLLLSVLLSVLQNELSSDVSDSISCDFSTGPSRSFPLSILQKMTFYWAVKPFLVHLFSMRVIQEPFINLNDLSSMLMIKSDGLFCHSSPFLNEQYSYISSLICFFSFRLSISTLSRPTLMDGWILEETSKQKPEPFQGSLLVLTHTTALFDVLAHDLRSLNTPHNAPVVGLGISRISVSVGRLSL